MLAMIVAGVVLAAGCVPGRMDVPENYVRLKEPGFLYADRAVSADGVHVAVRKPQAAQDGNLDFWARAVRNQLAVSRGYILVSEGEVSSADAVAGKRMDFTVTIENKSLSYIVAVWVQGDKVTVAEAGGPSEKVDAERACIEQILKSVNVK